MIVVRFNRLGLLVFVVSLLLAAGLVEWLGLHDAGLRGVISGVLLVAVDLVTRRIAGLGAFRDIWRGPTILWLPTWLWGALVTIGGAADLLRR